MLYTSIFRNLLTLKMLKLLNFCDIFYRFIIPFKIYTYYEVIMTTRTFKYLNILIIAKSR